MAIVNWTTASALVAVLVLFQAATNLYTMMNPLHGIDMTQFNGPTLKPGWQINQNFSLICYLSSTSKINFNTSAIMNKDVIVWSSNELTFSRIQEEVTKDIMVTFPDRTLVPADVNKSYKNSTVIFPLSNGIWSKLRNNQSTCFLHVLIQSHGVLSGGSTLHGSVQLIKYDIIPKSFRHRYLLSDFNLVNISAADGKSFASNLNLM